MDILRAKLAKLSELSSALQTPASVRKDAFRDVGEHAERFLQSLQSLPVDVKPDDDRDAAAAFRIQETPQTLDRALETLDTYVDGVGQNLGSSRFFAYIPSGGLYESALADYLAAVTNRYVGVGAAAPGAAELEASLLRWLASIVGYPESAEGDLTSGGSMAALSAIVTAREAHRIHSANVASAVVYLTEHTHHTFRKALHVAGLGELQIRTVAVDTSLRMDADALRARMRADREGGLTPWMIAATAGTTNTGSVDPLEDMADIAAEFSAWLHVDAAYGGAFAICGEGRRRLAGLSRSDSLIMDPHKGFFLPAGVGVLLVRDGQKLYDAYHARGTYMQDVAENPVRSPCDFSAELTRPFRGLRFWLPFKLHGSAAFAAALEEKLLLAEYFYNEVTRIPGIEVGQRPDLSIVPFWFRPEGMDADAAGQALLTAIRQESRIHMTSTLVDGRFTLRMAILTYNTHIEEVDLALQVIREHAETIAGR